MAVEAKTRSRAVLEETFQRFLSLPPHTLFGLTLLSAEEGVARQTFNTGAAALVPGGYVHGGVSAMLLEPTAMFALLTVLPEDRYAVTATSEYRYLRAVPKDAEVLLEAKVVRLGRTLAHMDASLSVDGRPHVEARYVKSVVSASGA